MDPTLLTPGMLSDQYLYRQGGMPSASPSTGAPSQICECGVEVRRGPPRLATLRYLVYALFFSVGVAQSAIVPLLPRLAERFTLSPAETALLISLPGLATLAIALPAGAAADRYGARRVTLAAASLLCLSCLAQSLPSLMSLLAGRVAFGLAFGLVWTTGMSWLSELDAGRAVARLGPAVTSSSVGIMIGPAIAGVVGQEISLGAPFVLIAGVSALITGLLAAGSRSPGPRTIEGFPLPVVSRPALRSRVALLRRPAVSAAAGGLAISGAVASVVQLLITLGLHGYGYSSSEIGLAFSGATICYILSSLAALHFRRFTHTPGFNAAGTVLLALGLVPAVAGGGPLALIGALLLTSLPRGAISTVSYSLASPSDESDGAPGVIFGMLNGIWAAAMVLTPLLAGAVEQRAGARIGYLAVLAPSLIIAVWLIRGAARTVRTGSTTD
jgi:MFS transporter, YNFM family, putative membrane transport protein